MTEPTPAAVLDVPPTSVEASTAPRIFHRVAGWSLFFFVVAFALIAGMVLRRYAWDQTEPIRYVEDIDNAFRQGTYALQSGYFERYDQRQTSGENQGMMDLDYGPGRLAVATLWTRWVWSQWAPLVTDYKKLPHLQQQFYAHAHILHPHDLNQPYELVRPMLMVNLTGEILSAVALFFLVRRYTAGKAPRYRPIRGIVLGLIAALFFWFDPALICNAHCWPQWDSWVMPFFLWAVLLASLDWWFCSGLLIATGAMFKGQVLFGAPLFLLWPIFQGRLPAVTRWIVGLLTAVAAITAVWLVRIPGTMGVGKYIDGSVNPHAVEWLIYLALIFAAMVPLLWWPKHPRSRVPAIIGLVAIVMWIISAHTNHVFSVIGFFVLVAVALWLDQSLARWTWQAKLPLAWGVIVLILWPVYVLANLEWLLAVVIATVAMATLLAMAPRRVLPYAAAGWMTAGLLLCIPIFGSSHGWFDLGLAYGTHHFERMANGQLDNLPELLKEQWGWDNLMAPAMTLPAGDAANHLASFLNASDPGVHLTPGQEINLPLKYALVSVWLTTAVMCALAAAIHDRNRSPRFLAAIVAPWIVFFAVMTQMHQRYLLWGASMSAATSVLSPGYAVLHLFLSVVSTSQELHSMLNNGFDPNYQVHYTQNAVYQFIENWHPGIAWAVLLTAAIFVYTAVKWEPVRKE